MTRDKTSLDTDDVLRLLAARRRRVALRVLLDRPDRTADTSTLAAGVRRRCEPDRVPGTADDIELQLHHADIPKLTTASVTTYDRTTRRVSYEGHDEVDALLELLGARFE